MASVTIDRIRGVRQDIADAVNRTSDQSGLSGQEQLSMLAPVCAETCQLLIDWEDSPLWHDLRRGRDASLREVFQGQQQQFLELLGPSFGDAMERAADHDGDRAQGRAARLTAARAEAERAVRAAIETSRRYPRKRSGELARDAIGRVGRLRQEVCELAGELSRARQQSAATADRVRRARAVLMKASGFLLTLAVTVAGPAQVVHDLSVWADEVKVVLVHDLAVQAQPGVRIAPPAAGPHVH